jgi:hypothetical protein
VFFYPFFEEFIMLYSRYQLSATLLRVIASFVLGFYATSCGETNPPNPISREVSKEIALATEVDLSSDKDVIELMNLRDEVVLKIIANKPDMQRLKLAVQEKDDQEIMKLLNYDQKELEDWHEKMKHSVQNLLKKYPSLEKQIKNQPTCTDCNVVKFTVVLTVLVSREGALQGHQEKQLP